jgi:uncharacterized membrane protein YsdA (DUF1294 family)/cold shock CspA family protein
MRFQGRITSWNDAKGIGTITWHGSSDKLFVHVSAFEPTARRPAVGDIVTYEAERGSDGRFRAVRVAYPRRAARRPEARGGRRSAGPIDVIAILFVGFLAVATAVGRVPLVATGYFVVIGVVTFLFYSSDKAAARRGGWRTAESTLHLLSLAGGWPGACLAQRTARHKTSKQSFQVVFVMTVFANLLGVAILASDRSRDMLRALLG